MTTLILSPGTQTAVPSKAAPNARWARLDRWLLRHYGAVAIMALVK